MIDFVESATLPKPAKVYLLSLAERNSLDMCGSMRNSERDISNHLLAQ